MEHQAKPKNPRVPSRYHNSPEEIIVNFVRDAFFVEGVGEVWGTRLGGFCTDVERFLDSCREGI